MLLFSSWPTLFVQPFQIFSYCSRHVFKHHLSALNKLALNSICLVKLLLLFSTVTPTSCLKYLTKLPYMYLANVPPLLILTQKKKKKSQRIIEDQSNSIISSVNCCPLLMIEMIPVQILLHIEPRKKILSAVQECSAYFMGSSSTYLQSSERVLAHINQALSLLLPNWLSSVNGVVEISSQSLLLLSNVCCSDREVVYPSACQNCKSSYWSVLVVRTILRFSPVAKVFLRWGDFIFGVPVPNRMDTSLWEGEVSCGFQWKTLRDQSYSQKIPLVLRVLNLPWWLQNWLEYMLFSASLLFPSNRENPAILTISYPCSFLDKCQKENLHAISGRQ